MDEDNYNEMMRQEHERIERAVKAATRGCGLLFLIIAIIISLLIILIKLL
jgi:hypothetical protein